jgi:hypothetical protein
MARVRLARSFSAVGGGAGPEVLSATDHRSAIGAWEFLRAAFSQERERVIKNKKEPKKSFLALANHQQVKKGKLVAVFVTPFRESVSCVHMMRANVARSEYVLRSDHMSRGAGGLGRDTFV